MVLEIRKCSRSQFVRLVQSKKIQQMMKLLACCQIDHSETNRSCWMEPGMEKSKNQQLACFHRLTEMVVVVVVGKEQSMMSCLEPVMPGLIGWDLNRS